ncbi:hypothetical protein DSO57_1037661 [Entomophthora muscae]|uniref:Uncharacterized protein n=1 Tax=Entomophthora muscae TaxID=34485 RepID=A0ACC2SYW3_9FUNG|nr:hypothetical protein DSO57_1037661 [Entomophthora muscae]
MAPILKEFSKDFKGGDSRSEDEFNKPDILEQAQRELIVEIQDAIDQIIFSKKMKVMAFAKVQAAKMIEEERLANSPGWIEALSEDVTPAEYKKYLGISNFDSFNPSEYKKPESPAENNKRPAPFKPTPPKSEASAIPTIDGLLNGAVKETTNPNPSFSIPQSGLKPKPSSFKATNTAGFNKSPYGKPGGSLKQPIPSTPLYTSQEKPQESTAPKTSLEKDQKQTLSLISQLRKAFAGFVLLDSKKSENEQLSKKIIAFRSTFNDFLVFFLEGNIVKEREKYAEISAELDSSVSSNRDAVLLNLHAIAQIVCKTTLDAPFKSKDVLSKIIDLLRLHIFDSVCKDFHIVFFAHLFHCCPAILPIRSEKVSLSSDSAKAFTLYCSMLVSENDPDPKGFFKLSAAWEWIVSFCSVSPDDKYCIYLDIMLEICGPSLVATYKDQAIKLLRHLAMHVANFSDLAAKQNRIRIFNLMAKHPVPAAPKT